MNKLLQKCAFASILCMAVAPKALAERSLAEIIATGTQDEIIDQLNKGLDPNTYIKYEGLGGAVPHWAAKNGYVKVFDCLKAKYPGMNLNPADFNPAGRGGSWLTPLHVAACNGKINIFDWFKTNFPNMDLNPSITDGAWQGYNLLHIAARNGKIEIFDWFKTNFPGMDLNPAIIDGNSCGNTPVFHAALNSNKEIVDLLSSTITCPEKCCFLTFEQNNDWNGSTVRSLLNAIVMKSTAIATPVLVKKLFEEFAWIKEYFSSGRFIMLASSPANFIVIIPESLQDLGITITESEKQNQEPPIDITNIQNKYGFKNLHLLNPTYITSVIEKAQLINGDKFRELIELFESIINSSSSQHPTRFYLFSHGCPGIIANIPLAYFIIFLRALANIDAEFLFIHSCYVAGTNLLKIQAAIQEIIQLETVVNELLIIKDYKQKLNDYKKLMKERMGAEPQKYGGDVDSYYKLFPIPEKPKCFTGINYAIAIQATHGGATCSGTPNINAMFTKLNEFLKDPSWALEFASGEDKPTITISDVITSLGLKNSTVLPSIRLPGSTSYFRPIDEGKMEIITASRLIQKSVKKTLKLIAASKSADKTIADEARQKLQQPLAIDFQIKPDIQFVQIFPMDLTDFKFIIQGQTLPKFISKSTGSGQHFIGSVTYSSDGKDSGLIFKKFIDQGFVNVFGMEYPAESALCWFIKSVELTTASTTKHITKLVIKMDPAPATTKHDYIGSYAYINHNGEFIISKEGADESKVDKEAFESTIKSWFNATKASQGTLNEATGGVEITAEEKAKLVAGQSSNSRLINPQYQRTADDLFKMFIADN